MVKEKVGSENGGSKYNIQKKKKKKKKKKIMASSPIT